MSSHKDLEVWRRPKLTGRVETLLINLGPMPSIIAGILRTEGIQGHIGSAYSCPIANYVKAHLSPQEGQDITYVGIGRTTSYVGFMPGPGEPAGESTNHAGESMLIDEIPTPQPVVAFLNVFDEGGYPELITPIVTT